MAFVARNLYIRKYGSVNKQNVTVNIRCYIHPGLFFRSWGPNSDPILKQIFRLLIFFFLTQNYGIFLQIVGIFSLA